MGTADLEPGKYLNKDAGRRGQYLGHGEWIKPEPFSARSLTPEGSKALAGLKPGGGGLPGGKPAAAAPAAPQMRQPVYENTSRAKPWALKR